MGVDVAVDMLCFKMSVKFYPKPGVVHDDVVNLLIFVSITVNYISEVKIITAGEDAQERTENEV